MNNDAKFEDRLRRQTLKPVPGEWREDILRRAAREVEVRENVLPSAGSWFEEFKAGLMAVFSPAPKAWAGLATVWALILILNLSGGYETTAITKPVSVAQTRMALKQKQMLLSELAGRTETQEAIPLRAISPGPRSQRREETGVA